MKWLKRAVVVVIVSGILFFCIANIWVVSSTKDQVLTAYDKLPEHRVALVLGTSHKTTAGLPNQFFEKRIGGPANRAPAFKKDPPLFFDIFRFDGFETGKTVFWSRDQNQFVFDQFFDAQGRRIGRQ